MTGAVVGIWGAGGMAAVNFKSSNLAFLFFDSSVSIISFFFSFYLTKVRLHLSF